MVDPAEFRLLVTGSRHWTDTGLLEVTIDQVVAEHAHGRPVVVVEGGAFGADRLAARHARARGWTVETYPADWAREGKAAGPRRNARMLRDGRPERCLAFHDRLSESRGTADMTMRAYAAGLAVEVVGHLGREVTPRPERLF